MNLAPETTPIHSEPTADQASNDKRQQALTLMRLGATKSHDDASLGATGAHDRLEAYLMACSDLSGQSIESERALARREPPPPAWQHDTTKV